MKFKKLFESTISDYFRNSKIRDNQGNLLVLYNSHSKEKGKLIYHCNKYPYFFSASKEYSKEYGDTTNKVHLNITNPFYGKSVKELDIYNKEFAEWFKSQESPLKPPKRLGLYEYVYFPYVDLLYFFLKENHKEYDGIIANEGLYGNNYERFKDVGNTSYIPFYSNQIKLITNENPTSSDYINEAFLDAEQKFYDYGTSNISDNIYFDVNKSEMSFYNDIIHEPKYMEKEKNLKGEIKQLSPKEYFEECAKIFNTSYDKQIVQTKADTKVINHLKDVINIYNKRFPITMLDYANNTQEGRHRMYVIGELFGWNIKQPVLIVDYADKDRAKRELKEKESSKIERNINRAIDNSLMYNYYTIDEFKNQLKYDLDKSFDEDVDFQFEVTDDSITITVKDVSVTIDKSEVKLKDFEISDDDIEIDDIDFDDEEIQKLLNKYNLKL